MAAPRPETPAGGAAAAVGPGAVAAPVRTPAWTALTHHSISTENVTIVVAALVQIPAGFPVRQNLDRKEELAVTIELVSSGEMVLAATSRQRFASSALPCYHTFQSAWQ